MFRDIAVAITVLACAAGAGSLAAQTAAPTKPAAPPMQHAQSPSRKTAEAKPTPTHHAAWTKAEIQEAQQGLAKAGYYKGKPTGEMNADTRRALKAYQKANNMPATGRLSDSVLVKLKPA
jgi:peptidoglycan hydrolase-like protein with peptidoglycan-binding domain